MTSSYLTRWDVFLEAEHRLSYKAKHSYLSPDYHKCVPSSIPFCGFTPPLLLGTRLREAGARWVAVTQSDILLLVSLTFVYQVVQEEEVSWFARVRPSLQQSTQTLKDHLER